MKRRHSLLFALLLLQLLLPVLPLQASSLNQSRQSEGTRPKPVEVDSCPNFSPFDAAAILQEPVVADTPIGNLIFGPLPETDFAEGMQGFCGYTNELAVDDNSLNLRQPHLVTDLPYAHAVATAHLTGDLLSSTSGTMLIDWMDMIGLAEVVAAANPKNDGSTFDYLYGTFNIGDYASWIYALETHAKASPSFKMQKIALAKGDPRDELLWLWQTLDDGHFALLVSRQGNDFDLVVALTGKEVSEKSVQGYAQVVIEKIAPGADETVDTTTGTNSASETFCDRLDLAGVARLVGDEVKGQPITSSEGKGCKYVPVSDRTKIQPDDFSPLFETFGLLAGTVPNKAAERLLSGSVQELSTTGQVRDGDALSAILDSLQAQKFADALQQMAALDWHSNSWQVEAMAEIDEPTLLIHGKSGNGWTQFYLFHSRSDGGIDYLTGVLHDEVAEVRAELAAALLALGAQNADPSTDPSTGSNPESTPVATPQASEVVCTVLSQAEAESLIGIPLRSQSASGELGSGCRFTPVGEADDSTDADFIPAFATQGVLAGIMNKDGAAQILSALVDEMGITDRRLNRAVRRGEVQNALRLFSNLEIADSKWQLVPLPEVDTYTVAFSSQIDGQYVTVFLHGADEANIELIVVARAEEGDMDAMRQIVVAAFVY